jgi:hypothetical protein
VFFQLGKDGFGLKGAFLHHHLFLLPPRVSLGPSLLQHGRELFLLCGGRLLPPDGFFLPLPRLLDPRSSDFSARSALG